MSKELTVRKPRARHRDVVLGALNERLLILELLASNEGCPDIGFGPNLQRLRELLDELRHSLNADKENGKKFKGTKENDE